MNMLLRVRARIPWLAVALFTAMIAAPLASRAQQAETVDGLRINIGVVTTAWAKHFQEESASHPNLGEPDHAHHLVVSITDVKTGANLAGAEVRVEVRSPNRIVEAKPLVPRVTSGVPDYSEIFNMHESGRYRITVYVKTKTRAKPLVARFAWTNPAD
jgi:hypothetical protein